MKVKDLIEKLEKFNPEAVVKLNGRFGDELLFVSALANDDSVVWVEDESTVDMANEIQTRLDDSDNKLDAYVEMLKTGINVDMVRRYMGDDVASHMEQVCKEAGLL